MIEKDVFEGADQAQANFLTAALQWIPISARGGWSRSRYLGDDYGKGKNCGDISIENEL